MSQTREPPCRRILRQKKDHLPHDIALNILANLPVKSVLRFRSVSKTWDSSITTPNFISTHLNFNLNNNNNNLAYLINVPSNSAIRSFIGGYDQTFNRISEYPIPSALLLSSAKYVTSCNGLVCLTALTITSHRTVAGVIYLWNPSIRKFKRLPDFFPTKPHWVMSTGFAYQSETNDYKVVKISQIRSPNHGGVELEAEVYTLSSNSWRRVGISLTNSALDPFNNQTSVFVSGALHWLGWGSWVKEARQQHDMILSFDANNDNFGEIALPDGGQLLPLGLMRKQKCLTVFKGKLAIITFDCCFFSNNNNDNGSDNDNEYNDFIMLDQSCFIWVMGEYGVRESWSKLFFLQFENVFTLRSFGCTILGELLVTKEVNPESNDEQRCNVVVSLDLLPLHDKDLGVNDVPHIATTFMESLVLLDGATIIKRDHYHAVSFGIILF